MNPQFKIVMVIFAITMYVVGYIAWRVQNDALKRGYSNLAASFWSLAVFFMAPVMLPLYILVRERSIPEENPVSEVTKARRKLFITCPHCGEENPPEMASCQKCEKTLVSQGKSLGTKSCPYCGSQNDASAKYCSNCEQSI